MAKITYTAQDTTLTAQDVDELETVLHAEYAEAPAEHQDDVRSAVDEVLTRLRTGSTSVYSDYLGAQVEVDR